MGKRAESRKRIEAQVIEVGRRHLATHGAAGLSLRAVARDLGMVSSAVYRYVANRDDLLTLLLVDAYEDLADTADEAVGDETSWDAGVLAIAHAVREWAVAHPERWALLYGSPVPGYHAPPEATVAPGTRVIRALFDTVGGALASGDLDVPDAEVATPLSADFERLREEFEFAGSDAVLARCITLWAALIGAVSLEVFGQYGPGTVTDHRALFDLQVRLLLSIFTK